MSTIKEVREMMNMEYYFEEFNISIKQEKINFKKIKKEILKLDDDFEKKIVTHSPYIIFDLGGVSHVLKNNKRIILFFIIFFIKKFKSYILNMKDLIKR